MSAMNNVLIVALALCALGMSSVAAGGTLKVYVLAGQSNMEGQAEVDTINKTSGTYKNGTLMYQLTDPRTAKDFAKFWDKSRKNWTVLPKVKVWYNEAANTDGVNGSQIPSTPGNATFGSLSVGYGVKGNPSRIGPEYGFGFGMNEHSPDDTILIVKTAWGGKTLAFDFRPPTSAKEGAAGQDKYCPDRVKCGQVGHYYQVMMDDVKKMFMPGAIETMFPDLKGMTPVLSGFGWFQGWNDGCDLNMTAAYEYNMVNFIKDIRTEWENPSLPVSITVSGFDGFTGEEATRTPKDCWSSGNRLNCNCANDRGCRRLDIVLSQFAAANMTLHPELNGHVKAMETRGFWREAQYSPCPPQGYHWFHNAESYVLIGEAMATGMIAATEH